MCPAMPCYQPSIVRLLAGRPQLRVRPLDDRQELDGSVGEGNPAPAIAAAPAVDPAVQARQDAVAPVQVLGGGLLVRSLGWQNVVRTAAVLVEQRWSQAPLLTPHQNLACRLDALCGAAKRPLTVCGRWHRGRWQLASLAMERALTAAGESVVASPSAKAMSHPPLPPVRALPVARLDCCQGLLLCLGSSQGGQTRGRAGTRTAAGPRQRQRQGHIQRGDARRGRRFRRQRRRPQRQLS